MYVAKSGFIALSSFSIIASYFITKEFFAPVCSAIIFLIFGLSVDFFSTKYGTIFLEKIKNLTVTWLSNSRFSISIKLPSDFPMKVGVSTVNRSIIYLEIPKMHNVVVAAMTRFGKTTFMHSMIYWILKNYDETEVQILISDPKQTDYSIFGKVSNLCFPIAKDESETVLMIQEIERIMLSRIEAFKVFSDTKLCNSLDRYREIYKEQTGSYPIMPRIIAFFDELSVIESKETLHTL